MSVPITIKVLVADLESTVADYAAKGYKLIYKEYFNEGGKVWYRLTFDKK